MFSRTPKGLLNACIVCFLTWVISLVCYLIDRNWITLVCLWLNVSYCWIMMFLFYSCTKRQKLNQEKGNDHGPV